MSALPFSAAHRCYVKSLYKCMLKNECNWVVCYDLYRASCTICTEFEHNWYIKAEEELARKHHPGPYIYPMFPGGTKWCIFPVLYPKGAELELELPVPVFYSA
ncbi:NDUFB9, NADH-ubiquinone oxidoreductase [Russula ochroleuca]|uniref:NDUFB9, NADH-ubiquinone oxidoreductase n=1 Tax=Russula ochroleuca TaxID=152965 RepID=A0A9P5MWX0_9AGAM|nr:NDUFB9, NADH-ubiquinone oxidoreductase [Russula ochroleuca]